VHVVGAIGTIVANVDLITGWAKDLTDLKLPPPPSWLRPAVRRSSRPALATRREAKGTDAGRPSGALRRHVWPLVRRTDRQLRRRLPEFLLTVIAAAVLYAYGEEDGGLRAALRQARLPEARENAMRLSGQAIRGVALAWWCTALVQALIGGSRLMIAGVPFAPVLTALMFLLASGTDRRVPVLVIRSSGCTGAARRAGARSGGRRPDRGTLDNFLRPS